MNTTGSDLMSLLAQKMGYLQQKQAVHAENVANSSTPGYKAREISAFTFGDALKQAQVGMATTNPGHIIPASMSGTNRATVKVKDYDTSPNGNAVDAEQESMKMSQTNVEYQLMTTLYKKFQGLMRIAVKGS